ncbi:MAG: hypothetical protein JNL95_01490 [Chitinophagales bacterium]|nr:hypothetical protein [Chitinophagales bacterium]
MTALNLLLVFLLQHSGSDTSTYHKQSVLFVKEKLIPAPSNQLLLIIPPPTQGFFCNFEDQIQRKKVPVDFGLKLK